MRSFISKKNQTTISQSLIKSFFTFSDIMFDNIITRIESIPLEYNKEAHDAIKPLPLFEKFFMLLHNFYPYQTIIEYTVPKLKNTVHKFIETIMKEN